MESVDVHEAPSLPQELLAKWKRESQFSKNMAPGKLIISGGHNQEFMGNTK